MTTPEPAVFAPTDRQRQLWKALESRAPESGTAIVGYGGAMGGGKTRALVELAIETAASFPGTRILIARLRYTDLRSTTMAEFYRCCPEELIIERRQSPPESVVLRSCDAGSGAPASVHFRHLTDWRGLGSEQYGAVFIDEAGEVPEAAALMLVTRLRHPAQPFRYFVAASNPWPGWFERWFVRRELPEELFDEAEVRLAFIPARIRDNPWLPPNYEQVQRLLLPEDWVERFVEGKFESFVGLVYPSFDRLRHRWDGALPPFARFVGGLDFGGLAEHHHFTAGIVAGLTDVDAVCGPDVLIRLGEFEERGPGVIERLERWMQSWQERVGGGRISWRADRSQQAWISRMQQQVMIEPSDGRPHSVNVGIERVQRWLQWDAERAPRSYYRPTMRRFPERMLEYRWQSASEGDGLIPKPRKVDDDLLDADRYMHEEADRRRPRVVGLTPLRVLC